MIRHLISALKIISAFIALLFLAFVVINWGDEELKPEVAQALAWKAPANAFEDNGYLIVLGLEAPLETDAAIVGQKRLEAELARFAAIQKTHKETPALADNPAEIDAYIDWKDNQCDYQKQLNCVDFYLQQGAHKLAFVLLSQDRLTTRFAKIRQAKNYVEVMAPLLSAQFPKYQLLMQASELERIRAITHIAENQIDIGMEAYVNNAMFSRRLLRESNTLVSHMIAAAMMQRDTRILSELMTKYPKIATQYAAQLAPVVAPISAPEYNLNKAFRYECAMAYQLFDNLQYASANELTGSTNFLKNMAAKFGYSPNATNNAALVRCDARIKMTQSDAQSLDVAKAINLKAAEETMDVVNARLFTQKNPIGRILLGVAEPDYANYIERQHDLDGYLKMVKLQLTILADGTKKDKTIGIELLDPYTQKPMPYDVSTGVITFVGRQPSNTNLNKSNIYQVKL